MAEAVTEMVIPGTYIDVRAEGLIAVSGISTGNIGIVGTAARGPVDEPIILSSLPEAFETFGEPDAWQGGSADELTLVRALEQVFSNGGSTVYAVRTSASGGAAAAAARRALPDATGTVVTLTALTPGTWGHEVRVQVRAASANAFVERRAQTVPEPVVVQPLHANIAASPRNNVRLTRVATGQTFRLELRTSGAPSRGVARVQADGALSFHADDQPVAGDTLVASYEVSASACRDVQVEYGPLRETYTVADATDLARDIAAASGLVAATIAAGADPRLPDVMTTALPLEGGSNGEGATPAQYSASLALLDTEPVNIVVLAGQPFGDAAAALAAHAETTENAGRERLTVVGADSDTASQVAANADEVADDRVILVAPGIRVVDRASGNAASLPPAYAAAAIAGLLASLAVHVSPTNKSVRVLGLTRDYNDGEVKNLLNNRVLVLDKKAGYRVVKGISTDDAAFRQISVRRIVDYAKEGVRRATLPYIGRLNNARVRSAMQGTLNGFLSQMVVDEQLTEFQLEVSATREQEVAGIAQVVLYLKPTFSIDYVRVIMNLA
ncbi:MAG: phage tail sheath subtilisin-like domain-containing protein [Ectothiorhodospiraceae bacterium]|nr:phage tail sheath subtilisin-like domain-containing protein [Chromatiales bacterium]MCP5157244.1 phage tail sheath subtilisin-like domain-containing protein [Ectothiorhodospiraceae bacterium]